MNINTNTKRILYFFILGVLLLLLIGEYTYVHPYNPGMGFLGPKWTYISTKTFTWWFLLLSSIVFVSPLIRKQKIGLFGLFLFTAVIIRPFVQHKFPEETVKEFYLSRKMELNSITSKADFQSHTISKQQINKLGFGELIIKDSIFYFFCIEKEFPFGLCFNHRKKRPKNTLIFDRYIKYKKIENNWYEFDY